MDKLELTLDPVNNSLGYDVLLDLLREELGENNTYEFISGEKINEYGDQLSIHKYKLKLTIEKLNGNNN